MTFPHGLVTFTFERPSLMREPQVTARIIAAVLAAQPQIIESIRLTAGWLTIYAFVAEDDERAPSWRENMRELYIKVIEDAARG